MKDYDVSKAVVAEPTHEASVDFPFIWIPDDPTRDYTVKLPESPELGDQFTALRLNVNIKLTLEASSDTMILGYLIFACDEYHSDITVTCIEHPTEGKMWWIT